MISRLALAAVVFWLGLCVGGSIKVGRSEAVRASYYATGQKTASGERFRPLGMTCAHKTLPFGTRLRVTYRGRSAVCRVTDRGPFIRGRTLDVSLGVARRLGMERVGVASVQMDVLR